MKQVNNVLYWMSGNPIITAAIGAVGFLALNPKRKSRKKRRRRRK